MKNRKALITLISLSVVVVFSSIAWVNHGNTCATRGYAGGDCGGKGSLMGEACGNLPSPRGLLCKKDELGLDDNQVSKLKQLKSSSKKNKVKKHADLQILKIEIQELLDGESVDKNAVYAKLDVIGNLRIQMARDCFNTKLAAQVLLTPDQLKKWKAVKKSCQIEEVPGRKCDGKKGKGVGSQVKKDCGSSNWVDVVTQL